MTLAVHRREPDGDAAGLLVLFHGRGADELDLAPLFDVFDPGRQLLCAAPRGPLALPPGGAHWYVVRDIGFPDAATFGRSYALVSAWLDQLAAETGIEPGRTVLGGFSQGAVMTYALGLGAGRPRPALLAAFSGFIPTVAGWELDLEPPLPPVAIGHGALDPVIGVEWGRRARATLESAGAEVVYRESPLPHTIDPRFAVEVAALVERALSGRPAGRA